MQTINFRGELMDLSTPKVMGILNLTPDSFFDGGVHDSLEKCLQHVAKMVAEGVDILDIGGASSKPGSEVISEEEELKRILLPIQKIKDLFPKIILSVDTQRAHVAKICLEAGVHAINDISAGEGDTNMLPMVAQFQVPYFIMHKKGTPKNMQQNPTYENVTKEILDYLEKKLALCRQAGIQDVIVDVGFGFGKTGEHNFELIRHLSLFNMLEVPILVGVSRKSMIYELLKTSASEALNGTTALHVIALQKGAKILRVHDVKEAKQAIAIFQKCGKVA